LRQHDKDPQHNDKNVHGLFGVFVRIFDNMLNIFITQSNRELSICDRVRKILSLMTKNCMIFFGVFVCFAGIEAENRRGCIYRGPWMLWTTKTLGAMWSIQKNPMLRYSGFRFPEISYALGEFGFHNPECIYLVILSIK